MSELNPVEIIPYDDVPENPPAVPFTVEGTLGNGDPFDPKQGIGLVATKNGNGQMFVLPVAYPADSPDKKVFPGSIYFSNEQLEPGFKARVFPTLPDNLKTQYRIKMQQLAKIYKAAGYADGIDMENTEQLVGLRGTLTTRQQFKDKSRLELDKFEPVTR